jgi:hypothetical protein
MALNPSGKISLAGSTAGESIAAELSLGSTSTITLNDTAVRTLAGVPSGVITMPTDFWGKSTGPVGTAYWTAYAGYHYRPTPAASVGYYNTYPGDNAHCMITSTGDWITTTEQNAYTNPSWSTNEIKMHKWNSTGVYQGQYNWGNSYPNRNSITLTGAFRNRNRTNLAWHFLSGYGSPIGASPRQCGFDTNFTRSSFVHGLHPSSNNTVLQFSANASYAPNGNVMWFGGVPISPAYPTVNGGFGITTINSSAYTAYRIPAQTGADALNLGGLNCAVTSDPSSNFYHFSKANPSTNINWWKFNGSGGASGQLTISAIGSSYTGGIRADCNDSGTSFVAVGGGTTGIPVFAINAGGSIVWSTILTDPSAAAGALAYVNFDHTNNKVVVTAQYNTHSADGFVIFIIWLNPATGAITLQRKLKGQVSYPSINKPDVFLDRILLTVRSGSWNTGFNGPAPGGSVPLVINPVNVISLPAPGGAIGTAVGYQNTLTYSATTQFTNSPLSLTTSPNGLTYVGLSGAYSNYGLYPANTDYPSQLTATGSW